MKVKAWSIEIDEIQGAELTTLLADLGRMLSSRTNVPVVQPAPVAQLVAHEAGVQSHEQTGVTATPRSTPGRKGGRKPGRKTGLRQAQAPSSAPEPAEATNGHVRGHL
jgi:hypothetical protein